MGNRLSKTDNVTGNESYGFDNVNRLTSRNGQAYSNDADGNTLTGGGRTNSWDSLNRLTQCVYNGTTSSFVYGADGLRRRSTTAGVSTDYVLDGQSAVRTLVGGFADKIWLHGPRGPEYERTGGGAAVWNLFDGLGSVTGTVDSSGNIVSARKYDVYGSVRQLTGPSGTKHKFVGALGHPSEDETGLVYMRARWMDPVTGRFVSEDPAFDGSNWFGYVRNNPVRNTDSSGELLDIAIGSGGAFAAETEYDVEMAGAAAAGLASLVALLIIYGLILDIVSDWSMRAEVTREQQDQHRQEKIEANKKLREQVEKWIDEGQEGPRPKPNYRQPWNIKQPPTEEGGE
jgi:RHS repeat-associated protein